MNSKVYIVAAVISFAFQVGASNGGPSGDGKYDHSQMAQEECKGQIISAVRAAYKVISGTNVGDVGVTVERVEFEDGEQQKDMFGNKLVKFIVPQFVAEDGYISGTGGSVLVRPAVNGCEILKMDLSFGLL